MTESEIKICERFKLVRIKLGMKQGIFAGEIKTTQGHVSDIENKRKSVSDRIIEIICLKFNINEEWLRKGVGEIFKESYGSDELSGYCADITEGKDPFIAEMLLKYKRLSPIHKKAIWEIYEEWTKKKED